MEEFNYDKDLFIDIDELEVEWINQPMLYKKYSELSAQADEEVNKAKQNLELKRAETFEEVRNELLEAGEKTTEKIIESGVLQNHKYVRALDSFNRRKHEADVLKIAVRAFEMRKSALENLVKLAVANWFASPIEPKNIQEIKAKSIDSLDEEITKNLNNNRSKKTNGKKRQRK